MKSYPIELGGKTRNIRYNFNALCDIEEATGKPITEISGLSSIRVLLWAGLRWEDRGLTAQRVGTWIEEYLSGGGDMQDLVDAATNALNSTGIMKKRGEQGEDKPGEQ